MSALTSRMRAALQQLNLPLKNSYGTGAKATGPISVEEFGDGVIHKTVITLTDFPVDVGNTTGASFGGAKLYDFPAGVLNVLGCVANLAFDWAGTDIGAGGAGDFSLGTTITADATLSGTDANLLASTAMTDPAVAGVTDGAGHLATAAIIDGHSAAASANLNIIIDDADVENGADDVVKVSGTITIVWINNGDY